MSKTIRTTKVDVVENTETNSKIRITETPDNNRNTYQLMVKITRETMVLLIPSSLKKLLTTVLRKSGLVSINVPKLVRMVSIKQLKISKNFLPKLLLQCLVKLC